MSEKKSKLAQRRPVSNCRIRTVWNIRWPNTTASVFFSIFIPKTIRRAAQKRLAPYDALPDFKKLKTKVLGVSVDSIKSHEKFADKYGLPFTLLADEDKKVVKLYGVWVKKKFMGREYMGTLRTSFLIDDKDKIAKIYENVRPEIHAQEVMDDLKKLK